jgi:hypothetical protein
LIGGTDSVKMEAVDMGLSIRLVASAAVESDVAVGFSGKPLESEPVKTVCVMAGDLTGGVVTKGSDHGSDGKYR